MVLAAILFMEGVSPFLGMALASSSPGESKKIWMFPAGSGARLRWKWHADDFSANGLRWIFRGSDSLVYIMNKFVSFVVLLCLGGVLGAQARVGGHQQVEGNSHANSLGQSGVSAAKWPHQADVVAWGNLNGGIYRRSNNLSKVDLAGSSASNGSSYARITQGGRTISSASVTSSGSRSSPPRMVEVLRVGMGWTFGGLVSFTATGTIGAGLQYSAAWTIDRNRREAMLGGAMQVWGYGDGKARLTVLWGAASAKVGATLNYLNTTIQFNLRGTPQGITASSARLSVILWELVVRFKAEIAGQTVASDTLVNHRGPSYQRNLF